MNRTYGYKKHFAEGRAMQRKPILELLRRWAGRGSGGQSRGTVPHCPFCLFYCSHERGEDRGGQEAWLAAFLRAESRMTAGVSLGLT